MRHNLNSQAVVPVILPEEKAQQLLHMHNQLLIKNVMQELNELKDGIVQGESYNKDYIAFQISQAAGMLAYLAKNQGLDVS